MDREGAPRRVCVLDVRNSILTVDDVLSPSECQSLIDEAESIGFRDAPVTTRFGFVMAPDVRDNTRVIIDDPVRAAALWCRLRACVPLSVTSCWTPVGLNERLRFYRYEAGQRFAWHRDGAFVRGRDERSQLTLLLYLNEGFDGGETEIDVAPREVRHVPKRGGALLFAHHVRHQGAPVPRGRKYVLRSDVMYVRADANDAED